MGPSSGSVSASPSAPAALAVAGFSSCPPRSEHGHWGGVRLGTSGRRFARAGPPNTQNAHAGARPGAAN
jgi:hypothetical protein